MNRVERGSGGRNYHYENDLIHCVTEFVHPPIPIRSKDWIAVQPDYEPGMHIGYGETEQEAIADLDAMLQE